MPKTPRRPKTPKAPRVPRVVQCYHCNYSTKLKSNLQKHIVNVHVRKRGVPREKLFVCPLCSFSTTRVKMIDHYSSHHEVKIIKSCHNFLNMNDFKQWKIKIERDETSRYIVLKGVSKLKTCNVWYYRCHRDGFFNSKGTGKRNMKNKGTNKINGCCPSEMKVMEDKATGKVQVHFMKTHVGHSLDLNRLPLFKEDRDRIADQLAKKVPMSKVLNDIKSTKNGEQLERIHLVTRKDVLNIASSYKLTGERIRKKVETVNDDVDSWVKQMEQETNVIRFYKPQRTLQPAWPQLTMNDFVLIVSNDAQLELLKFYGRDCICFDRTHKNNNNDLELTSLFIIDELRQGFPCAFLLSNRSDLDVISVFVAVLGQSIGCQIECNVFLSDVSNTYYNAWCSGMPFPSCRLFCTWHVDRAWRKHLNKIKSSEKRAYAYKIVKSLMQERDRTSFEHLLSPAISDLKADPEILPFGEYFENEYSYNYACWALCFRLNSNYTTNTHLESMHKTIKNVFCQGKKIKRFDKSLCDIMKLIREKLFDQLIVAHKGHAPTEIAYIRKRHEIYLMSTAMDLSFLKIDEGWKVMSSSTNQSFDVLPHNLSCPCHLRCDDCQICVHSYKCTCPEYTIEWIDCKHIHFLGSRLSEKVSIQVQIEQPHLIEQTHQIPPPDQQILEHHSDDDDRSMEVLHICESNVARELEDLILKQFTNPKERDLDLKQAKNEALKLVQDIFDAVESRAQLEVFTNAILPVLPTITAMKYSNSCNYK